MLIFLDKEMKKEKALLELCRSSVIFQSTDFQKWSKKARTACISIGLCFACMEKRNRFETLTLET